ncbi:hypothetical protein DFO73_101573 [Cytobacillus oceanisediminis]|uniref:Uncharacterized protein n=1 Tax=Cytobacillus oceanisediminis TaxID=665099 RepID=A0A2V3A5Z3_9BACI|nr:hypothetical protein [Cytobacillus oceanisediminis]PWW32309.1 hypothetical protein DFO73_101573 [Cytobacillus oceanisediminis]
MTSVIVYYQEQDILDTQQTIQEMKRLFLKQKWNFQGLFIDQKNDYEVLQEVIHTHFKKIDIIFLYNRNNIADEFYWQLLIQTATIENVQIIFYSDLHL